MKDQEAYDEAKAYPHLSAETIAYYSGKASVDYPYPNEFTDSVLRKAWLRGRRDALAENRLDADTEWN